MAYSKSNELVDYIDISELEDKTWFHGLIPKEEAAHLLQHNGEFLVREEGSQSKFFLSVHWDSCRHYAIEHGRNGYRVGDSMSFPTIPKLIEYLISSAEHLKKESRVFLKREVSRQIWELHNDEIKLLKEIGQGFFGCVYRAQYKSEVVAVKRCKEQISTETTKKIVQEGMILKQYSHPNIVEFKGIAAVKYPVLIVMEYCAGGALPGFLQKHQLSRKQLVHMAYHAAKGMDYLERKGCIHGDLAARNCLVAEKMIVKVCDFGMSRIKEECAVSGYSKTIPYKWTAPEALINGKYTSKSDVWSFGILMWEIFTECKQAPYHGVSDPKQIDVNLRKGVRMEKPEKAPTACYRLMSKCWIYKPEDRKNFQEIKDSLQDIRDSM